MNYHTHARDLMFYMRPANTDAQIVQEVVTNDAYGAWGVVKPDHIVVDIGGHIGSFSVFAAALGAKVYTYEAVQPNFDILVANMELNGFYFNPFKLAVMGKREKGRKVFIRNSNFGGNNMYGEPTENAPFEFVDCITLDDVFEDNALSRIDFLKLDCEGAEVEILKACSKLDKIKHIVLEAHGLDRAEEVMQILALTHRLTGKDAGNMPIMRFQRI